MFQVDLAHAGEIFRSLPPIHPILVNFTAALVPASLASDVAGRLSRRSSLTAAGWWTILYAALITPLTVAAGWYWYLAGEHVGDVTMTVHKWFGTCLAMLIPLMAWWRWRAHRAASSPGVPYLVALLLLLSALSLQGHLGGIMSFGGGDVDRREGDTLASGASGASHADAPSHGQHQSSSLTVPATGPTTSITGSARRSKLRWSDHIDIPEQP